MPRRPYVRCRVVVVLLVVQQPLDTQREAPASLSLSFSLTAGRNKIHQNDAFDRLRLGDPAIPLVASPLRREEERTSAETRSPLPVLQQPTEAMQVGRPCFFALQECHILSTKARVGQRIVQNQVLTGCRLQP